MSVFEVRGGNDRRSMIKRYERKSKQDAIRALLAERDALNAENERLREVLDELLEALQAIVDEVSDGRIPYSSDSYLPAHLVEQARAAIAALAARPAASAEPREVDMDEYRAMVAAMVQIDPATLPGLTAAQRRALSRFAKPAGGLAGNAQPVAWVAAGTIRSPHPRCVSSLAYIPQIDKDLGREYVPLYAAPVPNQQTEQQPVAPEDYKIPCDVMLPPATRIKRGCSLKTLMVAMAQRESLPPAQRVVAAAPIAQTASAPELVSPWIRLTDRMPNPDEHRRVLIYTEGYDFGGEQVFDVRAETLNEAYFQAPDQQPEVLRFASHWMPIPAVSALAAAPVAAQKEDDAQETYPQMMPAELSQFLSDVMTAAGLVSHGKQCKALGERLGDACMRLRLHYPEPFAALEAAREDAERYRLLRRKVCIAGGEFHILNLDPRYIAQDSAAELDAAIDAAMLEAREQ